MSAVHEPFADHNEGRRAFSSAVVLTMVTANSADCNNHVVRKMSLVDSSVITVAGTAQVSGHADGPGGAALFTNPSDVAVAADGSILVVCGGESGAMTPLH